MYVCMYACMYVCNYVCMHINTSILVVLLFDKPEGNSPSLMGEFPSEYSFYYIKVSRQAATNNKRASVRGEVSIAPKDSY